MRLLEGHVEDAPDPEMDALHDEVRQLRIDLSAARSDAAASKRETVAALSALRKQLTPLYRALQAVFGELDAAGVSEGSTDAGSNPRVTAVWDSWKRRLGPSQAAAIDALLLHGEMNTTQLAIAIGKNRNTIPNIIFALNKAGLINKNGGRFSLKQL